ncbi:MAG TPA: GNAT family N-acetyltransferase [Solirubrobacteraceae bacterium]|jgi:L-amino acid N-acyltransferase YncA|nr:GNAT family N-acetyltransferase [Solirubrobacteraceae bacterium]
MLIDDATEADVPEIAAIYNDVVATSTAVFSDKPVTDEDRLAWLRARQEREQPVLVAREAGVVVGFASYGDFRSWPGYRSTVEHSVHVAAGYRRQGIGRELVQELLARATRAGMHVVVAAVDADNHPSLRLHEELGFDQVGEMPEVARKFDRWVDLVLLQITL